MKSLRCLVTLLSPVMLLACLFVSVLAQSDDKKVANVTSGGSSVRFDVVEKYSEATLTVTGPEGYSFRKAFRSGASPEFSLTDKKGERLADGVYTYELRLAPNFGAGVKEKLAAARKNGDEDEVQRDLRKRGELPQGSVQSGSFTVLNGSVITAGASEGRGDGQAAIPSVPAKLNTSRPARIRPAGLTGLRNHVALINPFFDFVIADDLIVQGSA